MRKLRSVLAALPVLMLSACFSLVSAPPSKLPLLHLSPQAFGSNLSLSQRLTLVAANNAKVQELGAAHSLDSLLEINAQEVRMAGFAIPWRADPERILRDIQLAFWPYASIVAALPKGWTLVEDEASRTLQQDGVVKMHIRYSGSPRWQGTSTMDNRAEGYLLKIESSAQE